MANWNNPIDTSLYTVVLAELKGRDTDAAFMFDPAIVTPTNLSNNTIRWNSVNSRFEILNGTWGVLDTEYDINVTSLNNLTDTDFLKINPGGNQTITSGKLILDIDSAAVLDIKGGSADEVYIQIFADAAAQSTRSGYIGFFGAASEDLSIVNEFASGSTILATNNTAALTLDSSQNATIAGTTTTTKLTINSTITGGIAGINIPSPSQTTGSIFNCSSTALSAGNMHDYYLNSSTFSGNMMRLWQDHSSATGTLIALINDGTGDTINLTHSATSGYALWINASGTLTTPAVEFIQNDILSSGSTLTLRHDGTGPNLDLTQKGHIKFPAIAVPSTDANTLDDYQEGNVTVVLEPTGLGTITMTSTANSMVYTKIGRTVHIGGQLSISSISGPTGNLRLSGLPYAIADVQDVGERCVGVVFGENVDGTGTDDYMCVVQGTAGNTSVSFRKYSGEVIDCTTDLAAGASFNISLTYTTDE